MRLLVSAASKLARTRAFQFAAIGGVLAAIAPQPKDDRAVVIDAARVFEALRAEEVRVGRPLTRQERDAAGRELVDEAVLAREAARLGLGTDDPIVRARLAEQMRASFVRSMPPPSLDPAELDAAIAREIERAPVRARLAVWFVSRDRAGAASAADGVARAVAEDRERARGLGDRPPIPDGAFWTEDSLARVCGPEPARAAFAARVGEATAAKASAWGHYVFLPLERRSATPDEVRSAAQDSLLREKASKDLAKIVERARRDYRIELRMPPGSPPLDIGADPAPPARGID